MPVQVRAFAMIIALALAVGLSARSAEAGPEEDSRAVIERQLDAFQRDAWAEAFQYAAPNIHLRFGSPDNFGAMVRNGYPMVWRPADIAFLGAEMMDGQLMQSLEIVDGAGRHYIARYLMVEVDGAWRIAAVRIEESEALGA